MAHIISLTNQKGGVGKTTTSVNLSVSLAVSEVKTLLIDLDPQFNATTGIEELLIEPKGNIYDALIRGTASKDVVTKTKLEHLDIVTSTSDLVGAEVELVSIMAREHQLEKVLKLMSLLEIIGFSQCQLNPKESNLTPISTIGLYSVATL